MTLQEAKDKAAYNLYSKRFDDIQNTDAIDHRLRAMELAAELYAQNKQIEVLETTKQLFLSVTCSACLQRTGPRGLSALGVREWTCSCGASHDRDVNAAKNILRIGLDTPIKGIAIA